MYTSINRGKTSRRARDLHLVKSLKAHLRSEKEGDVLAVLEEVKTLGVRRQAVITLITSSHLTVTLLQGMLNILMPLYAVQKEGECKPIFKFSSVNFSNC